MSSVTTQFVRVSQWYVAKYSVAPSNGVWALQALLSSSVEVEAETEDVGWPCYFSSRQQERKSTSHRT